jgi:ketosteroid isomerase-like protein
MRAMDAGVNDVAGRLRDAAGDLAASQEALSGLFADEVQLRHDPPHPSDGPIPGRLLAEVSRREVAAVTRALPDAVHSDSEITVDGDGVGMRGRTRGVLPDGTEIDVRTNTLFTVADGRIVGLLSDMDPASMESWGRVLAAGGFQVPAELLERLGSEAQ